MKSSPRIVAAFSAFALTLVTAVTLTASAVTDSTRSTPSAVCDLAVPAGSKLVFHAYATGFQIYRWTGSAWTFVAPAAVLYADSAMTGAVGTHYAGPRWQFVSGGIVLGKVIDRCTADPSAIQWLSLQGTPEDGAGVFQDVTFIQRLNTVGGLAPSYSGSTIDEVVKVPYTAEYYFYKQ